MKELLANMYLNCLNLKNNEEGQDLVEYALLVALIALVCVAGIQGVASAITGVFSSISNSLS